MGTNITRNGSVSIAKGDDKSVYLSDLNYGAWKQNGGKLATGVTDTEGEYSISTGTAGAYASATGVGFCGSFAKVGVIIEIESGSSDDLLEIVPTVQYEGYLGVNGAGTGKIQIGGEVANAGASDFVKIDSDDHVDHSPLLMESKTGGVGYADSWNDTVVMDGSDGDSPLYINSPEAGDKYRVDVYGATTSEVALSYASIDSNAGGKGVIDDLTLANMQFNWV